MQRTSFPPSAPHPAATPCPLQPPVGMQIGPTCFNAGNTSFQNAGVLRAAPCSLWQPELDPVFVPCSSLPPLPPVGMLQWNQHTVSNLPALSSSHDVAECISVREPAPPLVHPISEPLSLELASSGSVSRLPHMLAAADLVQLNVARGCGSLPPFVQPGAFVSCTGTALAAAPVQSASACACTLLPPIVQSAAHDQTCHDRSDSP